MTTVKRTPLLSMLTSSITLFVFWALAWFPKARTSLLNTQLVLLYLSYMAIPRLWILCYLSQYVKGLSGEHARIGWGGPTWRMSRGLTTLL